MAKIVNSWNDWDPLKRVIVGRCDNSMIPPEEPATSEKVPVDSEMRGMWGLRPLRTVERATSASRTWSRPLRSAASSSTARPLCSGTRPSVRRTSATIP